MTFKRYQDLILGLFLTLGALLFILVLIPQGVQVPESNAIPSLSPDFWIKIIVWSMLAVGLGILYHGIRTARAEQILADEESGTLPMAEATIKVVASILLLFIYWMLISVIGMIAASMAAIVVFAALCGERRWKVILPLALLLPVGLYYFFLKVASIPMPLGLFE